MIASPKPFPRVGPPWSCGQTFIFHLFIHISIFHESCSCNIRWKIKSYIMKSNHPSSRVVIWPGLKISWESPGKHQSCHIFELVHHLPEEGISQPARALPRNLSLIYVWRPTLYLGDALCQRLRWSTELVTRCPEAEKSSNWQLWI